MTLDHIGIAALPEAQALFEALLGAAPYRTERVEREGVTTVFFGDGGADGQAPKVELLETDDPESPVGRFLASRGPGLHHLAFEVSDLEAAIARVEALGVRRLGEPRAGADGKRIVFLHPKDTGGVLVELLETPRMPRETVRIPTDGAEIAVHVSGPAEAAPLVVLHGALGSTALETDRLVRFWERRFRVHAVDLRGHGASLEPGEREDAPRGAAPTWEDYTGDVVAVVEALGLEKIRLFGFSMGGGVALAVAARLGKRVERLAVHGVNVRWNWAEVEAMVGPMERVEAENPFWARRLAETHGAERWRGLVADLAAFTRALPGQHMSDLHLNAITASTLVSAGDADRFFDVRHAVDLYRAIPEARLWILPGLDHPIQGVDAEAFAQAVGAYLSVGGRQ